MNDAIQLDRLSKRFKRTEALKDVTLNVPEGSVFALLGENGAGKTTAIRIMLGLERPDSGHARVLGYDSKSEDLDIRRRVGYVPETPDLYDWMTVYQIGWYAAGFYPQGYWDRFTAMAEEFELPAKAKIKTLSKGMRAKVSLSLALSHDPDLLILDEPTSGLDAMVRREFLESMVQRAADGRTVFLSSHQINEVERVAEYVALIRQGDLLLVKRLEDLKARSRMISMTLAGEAVDPQLPEGRIVDCQQEGRRLRWLATDMPDARIGEIGEQTGVESVDVHRPNLEEIFVAHMKSGEGTSGNGVRRASNLGGGRVMNGFGMRAWGRILWREAAEQYAFCIGVFALLITLQASWVTMETFRMVPPPNAAYGFSMALFMTAIYAAASSALLFSAEVDAGTFVFQRTKPIGWFTYLWGKLSWVVLSSVLLGLAAWIETCVWLGVFPNARAASFAFGLTGVGVVEGIAWGLIASMLFREPLRAVVGGITLASLGAWMAVVLHRTVTGSGIVAVAAAYHDAAGVRLFSTVVVLSVGIVLVKFWYRTGQPLRTSILPRFRRNRTISAAYGGDWIVCKEPQSGRVRRLVWQAWRQLQTPALLYWGLCIIAIVVTGAYYLPGGRKLLHPDEIAGTRFLAIVSFSIVGLSSLLAGYTFGADQKGHFLQLARVGVSPWEIWLSRLAVVAAVLLPAGAFVLLALWVVMGQTGAVGIRPLAILGVVLGYVSVLVIGQACSMYVRSRIVALLAAPVATACFAFWIFLGVFLFGLGWKWGVVPVLLVLLIGTRMLTGTRLRQDNSWRAMRVPALLVAAAVVVTYQAFAFHRVNEIRPYDSTTQIEHRLMGMPPETIVENATRRYWTTVTDWNERHDKLMERALQQYRPDAPRSISKAMLRDLWWSNSVAISGYGPTHASHGEMLLGEMKLDHTLRELTSRLHLRNDQLRACIGFLEGWAVERTSFAEWLVADCQRDMAWLQYGPTPEYSGYGFHDEPLPWQYRWFTFERTRALQLLDRACRIGADRADAYERALINDQLGAGQEGFGLSHLENPNLVSPADILP